jgi:anti-sigma regulatory factor (Ser/Thr protein kinase)
MPTISFPFTVRCDARGYKWLAYVAHQLEPLKGQTITLDAAQLSWFDANLCSPLGALLSRTRTRINTLDWRVPSDKVLEVWRKNGFNIHLTSPAMTDTQKTTIAYRRFSTHDEKAFISYVGSELLTQGRLPRITEPAKRRIEGYFHEVFNNAVLHSDSTSGVWTCGQLFPRKERLDFSITDLGVGFGERVRGFLHDQRPDIECIEWAMQPGNTTKTGDIPGGLGLKRLHDFISQNDGQLHIVSGDGCWMFDGGQVCHHALLQPLNGTFLNLSFNTLDDNLYDEDEERIAGIKLF